jgi:hypothetical protein
MNLPPEHDVAGVLNDLEQKLNEAAGIDTAHGRNVRWVATVHADADLAGIALSITRILGVQQRGDVLPDHQAAADRALAAKLVGTVADSLYTIVQDLYAFAPPAGVAAEPEPDPGESPGPVDERPLGLQLLDAMPPAGEVLSTVDAENVANVLGLDTEQTQDLLDRYKAHIEACECVTANPFDDHHCAESDCTCTCPCHNCTTADR